MPFQLEIIPKGTRVTFQKGKGSQDLAPNLNLPEIYIILQKTIIYFGCGEKERVNHVSMQGKLVITPI